MSIIPKPHKTEQVSYVLGKFRDELYRYCKKGKNANLNRELLLQFVADSDFRWFWQAGQEAVRWRVRDWARENLALVTPWFQDAEQMRPGFFSHPIDHFGRIEGQEVRELCNDFDILVKLGITLPPRINPPEELQEELPLKETHYPNGFNTIPKAVIKERPELEGMTREEAWLWDLEQRDRGNAVWIEHIKCHLTQGIEAFEEEDNHFSRVFCDWLLEFMAGLEESNPELIFKRRFNAARGCVVADATRGAEQFEAEALAKRLPSYQGFKTTHPTTQTPDCSGLPNTSASRSHREPQEHLSRNVIVALPDVRATPAVSMSQSKSKHQDNGHPSTLRLANPTPAPSSSTTPRSPPFTTSRLTSAFAPRVGDGQGKHPNPAASGNSCQPGSTQVRDSATPERGDEVVEPGSQDVYQRPYKRRIPGFGQPNWRNDTGMRQWSPSP